MKFQFPVVSLGGQIFSGKNHIAELLYPNLVYPKLCLHSEKVAFADEVKNTLCRLKKVTREFIEFWKRKEELPPGFSITMRETLILIGDGLQKIDPKIWIDHVLPPTYPLLITDQRYDLEAQAVVEGGGFPILIYRPGFENEINNNSESELLKNVKRFLDLGYSGLLPKEEKLFRYFLINDCENDRLLEKINLDLLPNIRNHFNV
jgi:hypothetical protein